jgi:hypothetical protein
MSGSTACYGKEGKRVNNLFQMEAFICKKMKLIFFGLMTFNIVAPMPPGNMNGIYGSVIK